MVWCSSLRPNLSCPSIGQYSRRYSARPGMTTVRPRITWCPWRRHCLGGHRKGQIEPDSRVHSDPTFSHTNPTGCSTVPVDIRIHIHPRTCRRSSVARWVDHCETERRLGRRWAGHATGHTAVQATECKRNAAWLSRTDGTTENEGYETSEIIRPRAAVWERATVLQTMGMEQSKQRRTKEKDLIPRARRAVALFYCRESEEAIRLPW